MTDTLKKRTSEDIWFDMDCTNLLNTSETITSVVSVAADQTGLTFGSPVINGQAITYPDGRAAAIGKVIRVKIAGGSISAGAKENRYTVRAVFNTNDGSNKREATVVMVVTNEPEEV